MEVLFPGLIIAFVALLIYTGVQARKSRKVSVTTFATDEAKAWEVFFKKLPVEFPKDFVKVTKGNTIFTFSFTIKKEK